MQRPFPSIPPVPPAAPDAKTVAMLVRTADMFGQLLQNSHQGFLSNRRQQRAAGFAVIELAQAVCRDAKLRAENSSLQVTYLLFRHTARMPLIPCLGSSTCFWLSLCCLSKQACGTRTF